MLVLFDLLILNTRSSHTAEDCPWRDVSVRTLVWRCQSGSISLHFFSLTRSRVPEFLYYSVCPSLPGVGGGAGCQPLDLKISRKIWAYKRILDFTTILGVHCVSVGSKVHTVLPVVLASETTHIVRTGAFEHQLAVDPGANKFKSSCEWWFTSSPQPSNPQCQHFKKKSAEVAVETKGGDGANR